MRVNLDSQLIREWKVLELLNDGISTSDISSLLKIGVKTIQNIKKKYASKDKYQIFPSVINKYLKEGVVLELGKLTKVSDIHWMLNKTDKDLNIWYTSLPRKKTRKRITQNEVYAELKWFPISKR